MAKSKILITAFIFINSIFGTALASENIWESFINDPNYETFTSCSEQIRESIIGNFEKVKSTTYLSLFKPDTFAPYLRLVEEGNIYALELGFQMIPIAMQNTNVTEELFYSLGNSIKVQPEAILLFLEKYCRNELQIRSHILTSNIFGMREKWDLEIEELNSRIYAIESVTNPNINDLKAQSINHLKKYRNDIIGYNK